MTHEIVNAMLRAFSRPHDVRPLRPVRRVGARAVQTASLPAIESVDRVREALTVAAISEQNAEMRARWERYEANGAIRTRRRISLRFPAGG